MKNKEYKRTMKEHSSFIVWLLKIFSICFLVISCSWFDDVHEPDAQAPPAHKQTERYEVVVDWKHETGADVQSSPAIGLDGTIYVGSDDNYVYAFEPGGKLKWKYKTGAAVRSSPRIGDDGTIYVGSQDNHLHAIKPDGKQKWARDLWGNIDASPTIGLDGSIYVGVQGGYFFALDSYSSNGQIKWKYGTKVSIRSSAAIGVDGTIYVASDDNHLYAFSPDGKKKWRYDTEWNMGSSPAIGKDGTIYVGSDSGSLYAIWPNGTQRWAYKTGGQIWSSPVISHDGNVYVGSDDNYLHAVDADTGKRKWTHKTGANVRSIPAIGADGTVYVGGDDHYIYAFDPKSDPKNKLKWKHKLDNRIHVSSIALGYDGMIYVGSEDNHVYGIKEEFIKNGAKQNGNYLAEIGWAKFGKDNRGTSRMEAGYGYQIEVKWSHKTRADVQSSPAIAPDGTIYVGSDDTYVYAFKPNGEVKWEYKTEGGVKSSPAIGVDGTIYVGSQDTKRDNYLHAIRPIDGSSKWRYRVGGNVDSSPAIGADGTIYVGSDDTYVYAIHPNGERKWRYKTGGAVRSSPAIGVDGTIYVGSQDTKHDNYLHAINPGDGSRKWRERAGANVDSSPAIGADGTIYVGCDDGRIYAITDRQSYGALKWKRRLSPDAIPILTSDGRLYGDSIKSSPVVGYDGTIYVGSTDNSLYALEPKEGIVKWRYHTGADVISTPLIGASGTIYIGGDDHYVHAINPDGSRKWRYKTGGRIHNSSIAMSDEGTIYVGSEDNYVYAIEGTGDQLMNERYNTHYATWPKFGKNNQGTSYRGDPIGGGDGLSIPTVKVEELIVETDKSRQNFPLSGVPPVIGSDNRVFFSSDNYFYANDYINPRMTQWIAHVYRISGNFVSSPAIGAIDGRIYLGNTDGTFEANKFNKNNKTFDDPLPLWEYNTEGMIVESPAIGGDGTVYVASLLGKGKGSYLYAFRPDKTLVWKVFAEGTIMASPVIGDDGTIYTVDTGGYIMATSPTDGKEIWRYDHQAYTTPAIGNDGTLYVGGHSVFSAINPDGYLKWSRDDLSYVGITDGKIGLIYPTVKVDGTPVSTALSRKWDIIHPVIGADGTIYMGKRKMLFAVKPNGDLKWKYDFGQNGKWSIKPDGTPKWQSVTSTIVPKSLVIGKYGTIYLLTIDSVSKHSEATRDVYLYAMDPSGNPEWMGVIPTKGTPTALQNMRASDKGITIGDDGTIIVINGDRLYKVAGKSSGLSESGWPKVGVNNYNTGRRLDKLDSFMYSSGQPYRSRFSKKVNTLKDLISFANMIVQKGNTISSESIHYNGYIRDVSDFRVRLQKYILKNIDKFKQEFDNLSLEDLRTLIHATSLIWSGDAFSSNPGSLQAIYLTPTQATKERGLKLLEQIDKAIKKDKFNKDSILKNVFSGDSVYFVTDFYHFILERVLQTSNTLGKEYSVNIGGTEVDLCSDVSTDIKKYAIRVNGKLVKTTHELSDELMKALGAPLLETSKDKLDYYYEYLHKLVNSKDMEVLQDGLYFTATQTGLFANDNGSRVKRSDFTAFKESQDALKEVSRGGATTPTATAGTTSKRNVDIIPKEINSISGKLEERNNESERVKRSASTPSGELKDVLKKISHAGTGTTPHAGTKTQVPTHDTTTQTTTPGIEISSYDIGRWKKLTDTFGLSTTFTLFNFDNKYPLFSYLDMGNKARIQITVLPPREYNYTNNNNRLVRGPVFRVIFTWLTEASLNLPMPMQVNEPRMNDAGTAYRSLYLRLKGALIRKSAIDVPFVRNENNDGWEMLEDGADYVEVIGWRAEASGGGSLVAGSQAATFPGLGSRFTPTIRNDASFTVNPDLEAGFGVESGIIFRWNLKQNPIGTKFAMAVNNVVGFVVRSAVVASSWRRHGHWRGIPRGVAISEVVSLIVHPALLMLEIYALPSPEISLWGAGTYEFGILFKMGSTSHPYLFATPGVVNTAFVGGTMPITSPYGSTYHNPDIGY